MSNYKPSGITLMLDFFEAVFDNIYKLIKIIIKKLFK